MVTTNSSETCLVFRCGNEYVFTHGEAAGILIVTLSTTATKMLRKYDVSEEELARQAAEWLVFTKRSNGAVDFTSSSDDLSEFRQYFFTNERLCKRAC
jgi:hypothetical protein